MLYRNIILAVLTIALSVAGARALIKSKPEAVQKAQVELGVPVQTARFQAGEQRALIIAQGLVEPARAVGVSAQVSGLVKSVSPELMPGAFVKRGSALLKIDPSDYQLAVQEAEARFQIAQQEVALEAGRREVALKEWEAMRRRAKRKVDASTKDRALRVPQQRVAEANLKLARSALRRAQLNLSRATLKAPFNAVVLSESVEKGQLIGPGAPVLQLAGTDAFWIKAAIPSAELRWLEVPSVEGERGSPVKVRYDMGDQVIEREGFVARRLSQLESVGRMAQLIIEVPNPLGDEERAPLLLGAQVQLEIQGRPVTDVIEVPRAALHEGDTLWLFEPEAQRSLQEPKLVPNEGARPTSQGASQGRSGRLSVKQVKVLRRRPDSVLISATESLKDGERPLSASDEVVTSRISSPVPKMLLRSVQ